MKSTIEIIKNSDGTETLKIIDETGKESKESEKTLGMNCIVYFHKRISDGEIFYVGISNNLRRPYNKRGRNNLWNKYTAKYQFEVEIVHRNLTRFEAQELEKKYVKQYGRKNLNLGTLTNLTDGGEGTFGCKSALGRKWSEESKNKISGKNSHFYGRKHSEEALIKISEASKRQRHSEERKLNQSIAITGINNPMYCKTHSEEAKKKISETHKGVKKSDEHRLLMGKKRIGSKHSEESKQLMSKAHKGKIISEETKKRMSEGSKGIKRSKESIEKSANFHKKKIHQYSKDGLTFIGEFDSTADAARFLNRDRGSIISNLKGRTKSAFGFVWKYAE